MNTASAPNNQPLVNLWLVQMVGTMIIAAVVIFYYRAVGSPFRGDAQWAYYALYGIVAAIAPATMYLGRFKEWLDHDRKSALEHGGKPHPGIRAGLQKSLAIGGALSEFPQAFGVAHLFLGGEMRWFVGATLITLALRLSYRPFHKKKA